MTFAYGVDDVGAVSDIRVLYQKGSPDADDKHKRLMVANSDLVEKLPNWIPAATKTSPGSAIHILHPKDQLPGSSAMRNRVQTSDKSKGQSIDRPDTSIEATPAKSRRQVCCWKSCGKKFASQKDLSAHVNEVHVRFECPDVEFQCHWEGCPRQGRGFNARYKMLIHIRTHTNEKPHRCVVCDKSFSRLENLKIHTRSHTGERPYSCTFPGCSKAYSNSSDRFKHIRTHQEQKPYKCKMPGCQKQYTDPSSLRKHVRTHRHAPDSSRMELYHSLSINTQINDVKMEVCSPSSGTSYDPEDLGSSRVCELRKYINTVRHLEKQGLSPDHFQTLHVIQNSIVDNHFPNSEKDNEDITKDCGKSAFSDKEKSNADRYRDVSATPKLIWQHQRMNSQVDIQKPYICSSDIDQNRSDQNIRLIKYEPKSSTGSPVSTHHDTYNDQLLKKEYKNEEHKNDLTCAKDDLHKGNGKSQTEFSTTSLLSIDDLSGISSAMLPCHQETNTSSCSLPPVLARSCCAKSPKLEHWKKRKLLISEKESLASIQLSSPIPTSNQPQQYGTSPISVHSMPSSETSLQSLDHPHFSNFSTTPNAPLNNSRSPLSHSHLSSSSHCPTSPTLTCPQTTPKPTPGLSSPTPLSSPCETAVPNLYLLHYTHPLIQSLFTNSYTPFSTITNSTTPSSLYTDNSLSLALSGNSLLPIPNVSHYNSALDYHYGLNRTHLLPSGPAFVHPECHPPGVKHVWEHPGFNSLPLLMNVENASLLSTTSCNHFTDSLRMMYQDIPTDLPSLYQSHEFRFPLYLGVNR